MKRVFKYEITHGLQEFLMPVGAKCVYVGWQNNPEVVVAWFDIDDENPTEARRFQFFGTGHAVPYEATYLGTANLAPHLPLVWHLYEIPMDSGLESVNADHD